MESKKGECASQPLRIQGNQERKHPFNREVRVLAKPSKCKKAQVDLDLLANAVNPETKFLNIISKDSARFHTALSY